MKLKTLIGSGDKIGLLIIPFSHYYFRMFYFVYH